MRYRSLLRRPARRVLRALSSCAALGRSVSSVRVLMYHSVDDSGSVLSVSPEALRRQLAWLRKNGWRGLSAAEFAARQYEAPRAAREIFLTFDDGYENFRVLAAPLLAEHGFPATVFVPCDFAGAAPGWLVRDRAIIDARRYSGIASAEIDEAVAACSDTPLMTWRQLAELRDFGIDVESHGAGHYFMTQLGDGALEE